VAPQPFAPFDQREDVFRVGVNGRIYRTMVPLARFLRFVRKGAIASDCWQWTGSRSDNGYGNFTVGGRTFLVHRLAYQMHVGPIPAGLQLDHLCRNRSCCNPAHLEPVTCRTNALRGEHPLVVVHRSNLCQRGLHRLDVLENLTAASIRIGGRKCKPCSQAVSREYMRRRRTVQGQP
jgi:hypothetical protein